MTKALPLSTLGKKLLLFAALLFSLTDISAQCFSNLANAGTAIIPYANSCQNTLLGSGTYTTAQVHNGGIYTFSTCNSGGNWATWTSELTGYVSPPTALFHASGTGPVCAAPRASVQWTSSLTGNINVAFNRAACLGFQGATNSAQLDYCCTGPGNPAVFGNNQWNVYVYNSGDGTSTASNWTTAYSGYYTVSPLSFNTTSFYLTNQSPSSYGSYLGCEVSPTNHSWSAKRTGFPGCGVYQIDIPAHDDYTDLLINGSPVFSQGTGAGQTNVWTGMLNTASTVELRLSQGPGTTQGGITISPITPPTLDPGAIGSSQTHCTPADPALLTETTPVSGGVGPSYSGGSYTYSWRYRDNCSGGYTTIVGANGTTYDPPAGLTVTRCYERGVTDACNNTVWSPAVTVTVTPLPVVSSVAVTNALCLGSSNGTITVSGSSGTPAYQYSIDNGATYQSSPSFTGLPAGSYTVTIRDAQTCSSPYASNPVVIGQPTAVTIATAHTDASCAGVYDGTITVTPGGGTPPYSYSLNGGPSQTNNVFSGLAAGSYTAEVRDNNGCTITNVEVVGNSYSVTANLVSATNTSCFGACDGATTISLTGGIAPYDYSINNIIFQASPTFTGLCSGNYLGIARDSKGCTDFVPISITQPAVVTPILDSTVNGLCAGSATAGIYISETGGTPGYTYLWNDASASVTQDLVNAAAGTYNVTVTDANGCTGTIGATVTQPLPLFVSVAQFNNSLCGNDSTGAIDITANGGTPPYSFVWTNGEITEDLVNLPAGSYTVTVTDGNGCQQTLTQAISAPTSTLTSSKTITNVTCFGACDGAVDLTVSGGTTPYTFLWSNFSGSEDLSQVCGGTLSVIITDKNGCIKRDSAIVSEPTQLTLTTAVTNISCNNASDGAIDITATGGTPGYTYNWNDLPSSNDPEDRTGLAQATYTVTVTDANNCTASTLVNIVNPPAINISLIPTHPLCNSANGPNSAGRINGTIVGGTPIYSFAWSDGSTIFPRNNVPAGCYRLTVTDSRGCTAVDSVCIVEPDPMVYNVFRKDVSCNGKNDGFLDLTAYGGTTPYSFAWSNAASTEDIGSLPGGNYTVTITDVNDCTVSGFFIIQEPTVLNLTLNKTDVACQGGNTGSVSAVVTGGTTPYSYDWNNGDNPYVATQNNIGGGTYCVIVSDSNNCSVNACVTVNGQPNPITVTPSIKKPTCFGGTDGFASVSAAGGQSPYAFNWSTSPAQTGNIATSLAVGTYTVTISDATGCSFTQTIILPEVLPIAVLATTANQITCQTGSDGTIIVTAGNGAAPYMYSLNGTVQQSDTFRNLGPGTYSISVRDANGCEGATTATIETSSGALSVDLTSNREVILATQEAQLTATVNSDEPIVRYIWEPSNAGFDFSNCSDTTLCSNPSVRLITTTTIIVTAVNQSGCATTDTIRIEVNNEAVYFMPTAFTPNGDGLNDRFEFNVLGVTTADVKIWNRWGELVFSNPAQPNGFTGVDGWDGTFRGKKAQFDTYTYQIELSFFDGRKETLAGTITVMQ